MKQPTIFLIVLIILCTLIILESDTRQTRRSQINVTSKYS